MSIVVLSSSLHPNGPKRVTHGSRSTDLIRGLGIRGMEVAAAVVSGAGFLSWAGVRVQTDGIRDGRRREGTRMGTSGRGMGGSLMCLPGWHPGLRRRLQTHPRSRGQGCCCGGIPPGWACPFASASRMPPSHAPVARPRADQCPYGRPVRRKSNRGRGYAASHLPASRLCC